MPGTVLSTRITVMKTSVPSLVQRRGESEKELKTIHIVSAKESLSSLAKLRVGSGRLSSRETTEVSFKVAREEGLGAEAEDETRNPNKSTRMSKGLDGQSPWSMWTTRASLWLSERSW